MPAYEDIASKFFEHFVAITDAINTLGGTGLWDPQDGFYLRPACSSTIVTTPLRVRSLVGLIPIFAVENLVCDQIDHLAGFKKRMDWFLKHRKDLAKFIAFMTDEDQHLHYLLAIPSKEKLTSAVEIRAG